MALASALLLTSCGTTPTASRSLPLYEAPIAKADFQTVRTTAYTHTEDDHVAYGAQNALGGRLRSATVPSSPYEPVPRALPVTEKQQPSNFSVGLLLREKMQMAKSRSKKSKDKASKAPRVRKVEPPRIGSAAADWSRWPVGTTFRLLSTGQTYKVDDYGWALAGRNTIDLYMGSRRDMNSWGVRHEQIQVIQWGDPQQSLALLQSRLSHKHCRRMALELQGLHDQAAALR
ncbi:hypothetical protein BH18VER1_BH18VER1_11760 [soil metagenome]